MNGDDTPSGEPTEAALTDASQPAGRHLVRLVFSQDTPAQRPCRRPRPQRGRRSRCPFCGPMGGVIELHRTRQSLLRHHPAAGV